MPGEIAVNSERPLITYRAKALREEIQQYFLDVEYWNNNVRKEHEAPIDPDPDGKLVGMLKAIEIGLRKEVIKVA